MRERTSEPLEPYESDQGYEWDYEPEPHGRPKVLWGRVLALALVILLAFLLGRWTVGSPEVTPAELTGARRERDALQAEVDRVRFRNQQLKTENRDLRADIRTLTEASPSPGTTPPPETVSYTVKKGDTLLEIADRRCGDPNREDEIQDLNDLRSDVIDVGQVLQLPADCTG